MTAAKHKISDLNSGYICFLAMGCSFHVKHRKGVCKKSIERVFKNGLFRPTSSPCPAPIPSVSCMRCASTLARIKLSCQHMPACFFVGHHHQLMKTRDGQSWSHRESGLCMGHCPPPKLQTFCMNDTQIDSVPNLGPHLHEKKHKVHGSDGSETSYPHKYQNSWWMDVHPTKCSERSKRHWLICILCNLWILALSNNIWASSWNAAPNDPCQCDVLAHQPPTISPTKQFSGETELQQPTPRTPDLWPFAFGS